MPERRSKRVERESPTGQSVSFSLRLDSGTYPYDSNARSAPRIAARLTLSSTISLPLVLEFFSSQEFEFLILNHTGEEVHRWGAGRVFSPVSATVLVSGEKHWTVDVPLLDANGVPLPPGLYIAQSYLLTRADAVRTSTTAQSYLASVAFSIQDRHRWLIRKAKVGDSLQVRDLKVPLGGPHGPVRPDEFRMVGVFDIDWITDTRFKRLLDNMMASPGAFKRVRVFKCLNSGLQESGAGAPPVTSSGIVWPALAAPMDFSVTLNGLAEITSRGLIPHVVLGFFPSAVSPSPVTPPASYDNWKTLVASFLNTLAGDARFGAAALNNWWFEVWNEPNNPSFWSGAEADYFNLYDATAGAVSQWQTTSGVKIRLGGPAIIYDLQWMQDFLTHVSGPPTVQCDFIS